MSIAQINYMNENKVAIFAVCNCIGNPGPTGVGAVILENGQNKHAIKLAKAVSNKSKNNHGEVEALLLGLKYITSLPTPGPSIMSIYLVTVLLQ